MIALDVEVKRCLHVFLKKKSIDGGRYTCRIVGEIVGVGVSRVPFGQHAIREASFRVRRILIDIGEMVQQGEHLGG
ncbi:hypothetical protein SDC9_175398 [bioreactor metagenome]|uniref:Uncharacterized protein n=1 Tax=bioreactor metagenome TaxID=1076179 RepID=A0A645GVA5_9ZZZZ